MGIKQIKYKKTTTKKKTTQTKTNNVGNEHEKNNKLVFFVSKYSVCNFSTFDTTCINHQSSIETNIYMHTSISFNKVKQDMLLVPKTIHAQH